jgi:hydrogenase nickel incorporation protein HypA/HybF
MQRLPPDPRHRACISCGEGLEESAVHEASIVRELMEMAERQAPAGTRVLEVHVSVGLLTGVSPDAMQFYFETLREDSLGSGAELHARLEPLRGRCPVCGLGVILEEVRWECPACGAPSLNFENGNELDLTSLVVDDGEPDHDRAEDPQEEHRHR